MGMAAQPPTTDRSEEAVHNIASSSGSTSNRKVRGRTLGHKVASLPKGSKLSLEFDERHRAIGEHKQLCASQQGIIVRNMQITSIAAPSWRKLDKDVKAKMLESLLEKFDIGDDPQAKKLLMKEMGKIWRDYRYELKKNYYDTHKTDEERLQNRPSFVKEEDWKWLIKEHWGTPKVKELSDKNKERRDTQQMLHHAGRKSFAILEAEEMKRTGVCPSRIRMFEIAYTSKDGSFSDVWTRRKAEEIQNLIGQRDEGTNSLDDDGIFTQVFGPDKHGRVRCRGHGITPTFENGTSSRFGSQAIEEARRESEIARKEAAEAKQELADYKKVASDEMNKMKEDMAMMMQTLTKLTDQNNGGSGGSEAH